MKIIKIIIQFIVSLMILLAVIGCFLPSESFLYREITVNAPPEQIHKVLNDITQMSSWSPWHEMDPKGTQYVFEGPQNGVGSTMKWKSEHEDVGTGSQKIIESSPPTMVKTEMYFGGSKSPAYATFTITKNEDTSIVRWSFEADYGSNPYKRFIPLMTKRQLGSYYEKGLNNLKAFIEPEPEPEEVSTEEPTVMDPEIMNTDS